MKVLVLSGGGSKGAWQAGVMRALVESGVRYDAIVGTSVGAVNALGYSCLGMQGLVDIWENIRGTGDVMSWNWEWPWKWSGVYDFDPLEKMLRKFRSQHSPKVKVFSAHVDLETAETGYVDIGADAELDVSAVIGSCSVAGIHRKHPKNWVDGGHREVVPVWFAYASLKATEVDVIVCDNPNYSSEWRPANCLPIASVTLRALEAMGAETILNDVAQYPAARVFMPPRPIPISSLDYDPKGVARMLEDGFQYAKAILGGFDHAGFSST